MELTALKIDELAKLLSEASKRNVTVELLQEQIEQGAPTNQDGTIHLFEFLAWLTMRALNG